VSENTKTGSLTAAVAALAAVLAVLVASDGLSDGLRYGAGAVALVALVFCTFRLGVARRAGK
jgi:hypothetical protein